MMIYSMYLNVILYLFVFKYCYCAKPPNIIFVIIDDLGWNDVSFHGSKQIPTPNIDALAKDGVILNNYYVQPICTPSRGSLMTGKYPIRLGLQHDVIYSDQPWGLSPKEKILPQYLKDLGYTAHGIGKWHLGYFHESYLPVNRGFDSFFGYWNGKEDFYTHFEEGTGTNGLDFHDNNLNGWNYTGHYGTNVFTSKATNIIKNHDKTKPLFLYLAHQAVHAGNSYSPLQAPPKYVNRFLHIKDHARRIFAGMVSNLDDSIGELFSSLDESGMLQNSLFVFTTDNGAAVEGIDESSGSNWPLRGSKYNMWEGGIRGVSFVWSSWIRNAKEKIASQMMHITDWLPTLYSVAGGDLKTLGVRDGFNMWPTICCNAPSPRNEILHNIDMQWKVESIRKDRYKLLKGSVFNGRFDGWFSKEGKKQVSAFTERDLKNQEQVYKKLMNQSRVAPILSRLHGTSKESDHTENVRLSDKQYCSNTSGEKYNCQKEDNKHTTTSFLNVRDNESLVIDCGKRPVHASSDCHPQTAPCLFDIVKDPCEYHNLAAIHPEIVKELEDLLDKYRAQALPIRNQPSDPMANPKYHGYAWIPWKDQDINS